MPVSPSRGRGMHASRSVRCLWADLTGPLELWLISARSLRRLRIADVAATIASHAHIGLFGVTGKPLEDAKPGAIFADQRRCLVGEHLLIGAGLHEFADP